MAVFVAALFLSLLVSGRHLLVSENYVPKEQTVTIDEFGEISNSLVCKYFTGRNFVTEVYWYSPNNIMGRDSCPFITKDND